MLKIINRYQDLDSNKLLAVYEESCPNTKYYAVQAFLDDWMLFLQDKENVCCLWELDGAVVTCLRIEPYNDGALITCLETPPQFRRKGFAFQLMQAVCEHLFTEGYRCIYAHILKRNEPSMKLHEKLGFLVCADSAKLVDGTVSQRYNTWVLKNTPR